MAKTIEELLEALPKWVRIGGAVMALLTAGATGMAIFGGFTGLPARMQENREAIQLNSQAIELLSNRQIAHEFADSLITRELLTTSERILRCVEAIARDETAVCVR